MPNDTYVKINANNPIRIGGAITNALAPINEGSGVYHGNSQSVTDTDLFLEDDSRFMAMPGYTPSGYLKVSVQENAGLNIVSLSGGPVSSGVLPTATIPNTQVLSPTTTGAGYLAGDSLGGIISLTNVNLSTGRRVVLRSVQLNDKNANAVGIDMYFFKNTPAAGTYTDNVPLAWGSGDSSNKIGQIKIASGDWLTDNTQSSVHVVTNEKLSVGATTLFMLMVPQASGTFSPNNFTGVLEFDQE